MKQKMSECDKNYPNVANKCLNVANKCLNVAKNVRLWQKMSESGKQCPNVTKNVQMWQTISECGKKMSGCGKKCPNVAKKCPNVTNKIFFFILSGCPTLMRCSKGLHPIASEGVNLIWNLKIYWTWTLLWENLANSITLIWQEISERYLFACLRQDFSN